MKEATICYAWDYDEAKHLYHIEKHLLLQLSTETKEEVLTYITGFLYLLIQVFNPIGICMLPDFS